MMIRMVIIWTFTMLIGTSCGKIAGKLGAKLSREISESISKKANKIGKKVDIDPTIKLKYDDLPDHVKLAITKVASIPRQGLEGAIEGSARDYVMEKYLDAQSDIENSIVEIYSFEYIDSLQLLAMDYRYNRSDISENLYEMANSFGLDPTICSSYYRLEGIDSPYFYLQYEESYEIMNVPLERKLSEVYSIESGTISGMSNGDTLLIKPTNSSLDNSIDNYINSLSKTYFLRLKNSLSEDILYYPSAVERINEWEKIRFYIFMQIRPEYAFDQGLLLNKEFIEKEPPPYPDHGFLFKVSVICFAAKGDLAI